MPEFDQTQEFDIHVHANNQIWTTIVDLDLPKKDTWPSVVPSKSNDWNMDEIDFLNFTTTVITNVNIGLPSKSKKVNIPTPGLKNLRSKALEKFRDAIVEDYRNRNP